MIEVTARGELGERQFELLFEPDDEVVTGLKAFASERAVESGTVTLVQPDWLADVTVERHRSDDEPRLRVAYNVEAVRLSGSVSGCRLAPTTELEIIIRAADGRRCHGGLVAAHVARTLALVIAEEDDETGLGSSGGQIASRHALTVQTPRSAR